MYISEEQFAERLTDTFRQAAEHLRELNPAAFDLVKGLKVLQARARNDGGEFKFLWDINASGAVSLMTGLESDKPGRPLHISVSRSGQRILIGRDTEHVKYTFTSDSPEKNVMDAYDAIATELLMQGQVRMPEPSAAERGFRAVADRETHQDMTVQYLVKELDRIKTQAAAIGKEFDYTRHELENGAVLLRTNIKRDIGHLEIEVSADDKITHNDGKLTNSGALETTESHPSEVYVDRLLQSIEQQVAALPSFCRPPARATISPTTI